MRSLSFYPKLALGNLRRNRKTYFPYLLACTVSIFTFYTLLAINLNGALDGMRSEGIVKSFTAIGTAILSVFCSAIIFYTNSFLVKRRKKELGLYSVLGMEKKNIGIIMLYETLLVALTALVLGVGLGMLLSQVLFWVLLRMVRFHVMIAMPVSFTAAGITFALFGAVFLLAFLSNLRQVHIADPVNLMNGAKQGEREPKSSPVLTVTGLLCLSGGYAAALYFQSPAEALMLFPLAAVLVIAGTYCLFTSGSIALLKLLRKDKAYYYQPEHFISVSGMIYRMKQNAAGLSAICILSCMVLVTVSGTVSLNVGAEDSLNVQYPYEYSINADAAEDGELILAGAENTARASGVSLINLQDYNYVSFMAAEQNGVFTAVNDFQYLSLAHMNYFSLIALEDYNRNEGTNIRLAGDEALLLVTGGRYSGREITVNGFNYKITSLEQLGKNTAGGRGMGRTFFLILPPRADAEAIAGAGQAELSRTRTIGFDLEGSAEAKQRFDTAYFNYANGLSTQSGFQLQGREEAREDWYASNGGFLFLGVYFGVLFMLTAALIIYYKQISEGFDDAERFKILQKVGMSEAEVKRTINKQILTVFFLPLLVAVIHVTVAFFPISRVMIIFGVINIPLLAAATALTVLVYALVYLLVFRRTARTYFGIVRR